MTIGIVTNTFDIEKGTGIARYIQELVKGLISEGFRVKLICSEPLSVPLGKPINHVLKLPIKTFMHFKVCDLLHAVTPVAAFSFPFINKARVVTHHELSFLFLGRGKAPYVTMLSPIWYRLGTICDKIIVPSTLTKLDLMKYLRVPEDRIATVNLGLDDDLRPLKREEKEHYTIGYLGTLGYKKRVDYLVRAFLFFKKSYPNLRAKLSICGSRGFEYSSIVRLVSELGLAEDVEFRGFVYDKVKTYNSFDVFVFPTEWEGFGLPILEAQKCGVPVIVRSDSHLPLEVTAHCMKVKSQEDMADKIYELLTNETLWSEVSKKGQEHSAQFTWKKMTLETIRVYEQALQESKL